MGVMKEQALAKRMKTPPAEALREVFRGRLSNLYSVLLQAEEGRGGGLTLTCRGDGSWFCVVRRHPEGGVPECAFGSGTSVWDAVQAANAAVAKEAWREDKFAQERAQRAAKGA